MKKIIAFFLTLIFVCSLCSCAKVKTEIYEDGTSDTTDDAYQIFTPPPVTEETTLPETTSAEETTFSDYAVHDYPVSDTDMQSQPIQISNAYFTLTLPAQWNGLYFSDTSFTDDGIMMINFRQLKSAEAGFGGTLFTLALVPSGTALPYPQSRKLHTLYTQSGVYTLFCLTPSDIQYPAQFADEYRTMSAETDSVLSSLAPAEGNSFSD